MNQRIRVLQELGEHFEQAAMRAPRRRSSRLLGRITPTWGAAGGRLQRGLRAVPVLLAVAAAIAVAGVALMVVGRRHSSPASSPSPGGAPPYVSQTDPALKYLQGRPGVMNLSDPACHTSLNPPAQVPVTVSHGTPSQLLPILSVLRRPRRATDKPPPLLAHRHWNWLAGAQVVYVGYFRLAGIELGMRLYVIPVLSQRSPGVSAGCAAAWKAALRRELPHIPAGLRTHAEKVLADLIALDDYDAQPRQGIEFFVLAPGGGSGGGGGPETARGIRERGRMQLSVPSAGHKGSATLAGLVPDGVATMTLRFLGKSGSPVSITIRPVNNVFAVDVPPGTLNHPPQTVIWRNAHGKVINIIRHRS